MTKRVLITGMSGTGKSAVIDELLRRGHRAVDLDTPEWSHWVEARPSNALTPGDGQDWVWKADVVRELLSAPDEKTLFVSGCAENMETVFDAIDTIVLLSAPIDVIMARLGVRSGEGYGQTAAEQHKVVALIETIEPLLRESSHLEIVTRQSVSKTVDRILAQIAD